MTSHSDSQFFEILQTYEEDLLKSWIQEQMTLVPKQKLLMKPDQLREQCSQFIIFLRQALARESGKTLQGDGWEPVKELLNTITRTRSLQGFTSTETALFVFSFKRPLFQRLSEHIKSRPEDLTREIWHSSEVLDDLGLYTIEAYQKSREEIIVRQNEEMLELSTPVVRLWDGILALPLIGTLDSNRTQIVMESLLQKIVETGADTAIIDITGVPTVDTLVAQHLIKTVTAARLMGADCIISGIRPQIAQTIVHLGVNLGDITTKASLADAFRMAIRNRGLMVTSLPRPAVRELPAVKELHHG